MIMTVCGPIQGTATGVTLSHEHLLLDLRNQYTEPADPVAAREGEEAVSDAHRERLQRNPYAMRDNLVLENEDVAADEIAAFLAAGGRTIVDCTCIGIRRDPAGLRRLAERTGAHIVAGCGWYTADTHPEELAALSVDALATEILRDLREGIGGSGVRAGIIGEIGTSDPVHPDEIKCLQAAALASLEAGLAIQVHTYPWGRGGMVAADTLLAAGVVPDRIVICHTDVELDMAYIRALLARGVIVQFDNFGKEFICDPGGFAGGRFVDDGERTTALAMLLREGWADQLLMTTDVCLKCLLRQFGGKGYSHVLTDIVPRLRADGIGQNVIDQLLIENPRRMLEAGRGASWQ